MLESEIIFPSESLRAFVHHYWVMKSDSIGIELNVMPIGCMKWMFHRGTPFAVNGILDPGSRASVCGQLLSATHVRMQGDTDLIFVFFKPYAQKMITGIPSNLFENGNTDLDDLGSAAFKLLKRRVIEAKDSLSAIQVIEDFIYGQLTLHYDPTYLKRLISVCHEIDVHPAATLDTLADKACLSERQLRRIFLDYIGMAPKQMMRTKRCLAASKIIQQMDGHDFTPIVNRLGFTDHSHLNKEFKLFAGMSPTDYLNHINDIRHHNLLTGYQTYHK